MKICAFFESLPPEGNAVALRASGVLTALHRNPYVKLQALLTASLSPDVLWDETAVFRVGEPRAENSRSFAYRIRREVSIGCKACWRLYLIRAQVDLVYISSPPFISSLMMGLCCMAFRKKYVFEVRDIYPDAFVHGGVLKRNSALTIALEKLTGFVYRKALAVLTATSGITDLVKDSMPRAKVLTVENGFPESLLEKKSKKFETFSLIFHGVLGEFQDVNLLCELASELAGRDDIDLIVIGGGSKVESIKSAFVGYKNLKFLGRLPFEETIAIVNKCHIGMSLRTPDPISLASFPVKNWEYLGLGIPSITTPTQSEASKFLLRRGCGIDVGFGSKNEILQAIESYRHDFSKLDSKIEACRATRRVYTREAISERAVSELVGIYSNWR